MEDVVEEVNDVEVMITKQYVDTSGDHCIVHFTNKYNNNNDNIWIRGGNMFLF